MRLAAPTALLALALAASAAPALAAGVEVDKLPLDFRGAALDWVRTQARPAPVALAEAVRSRVAAEAKAEDCSHWAEGDRVLVADLDGDGGDEGFSAYTLESCGGGGNNYVRSLVVWRLAGTAWTPVLDVPLGTKVGGNRAVTAISARSMTVGGTGEPFDSDAPPETIAIPAKAAAATPRPAGGTR